MNSSIISSLLWLAIAIASLVSGRITAGPLENWRTAYPRPGGLGIFNNVVFVNDRFFALQTGRLWVSTNGLDWSEDLLWSPNPISDLAFGNGVYVLTERDPAGAGAWRGGIKSSGDGQTWVTRVSGGTFSSVAFGNGSFVAVGMRDSKLVILESPDGHNWSDATFPATYSETVEFLNGEFVIIGDQILKSKNGKVWEAIASNLNIGAWKVIFGRPKIAFGSGLYMAIVQGVAHRSSNLRDWTIVTLRGKGAGDVSYGDGKFVIAEADAAIYISTDGVNWDARPFPGTIDFVSGIAYGAGQFVAVGDTAIIHSQTGNEWFRGTQQNIFSDLSDLSFAKGSFLMTERISSRSDLGGFHFSSDAEHWRNHVINRGLNAITVGNGMFVGVFNTRYGFVATSSNGWDWETHLLPLSTVLSNITFGNNAFVATSRDGLLYSPDGRSWFVTSVNTVMSEVAFNETAFVAVGRSGRIASSEDGLSWNDEVSATRRHLMSVAYGNGRWIAVGEMGTVVTSSDSKTWVSHPAITTNGLVDIAFGSGQFIAIAGDAMFLSTEGKDWERTVPMPYAQWRKIAFGNDRFAAILPDSVYYSDNGRDWQPSSPQVPFGAFGVTHGDAGFVTVGGGFIGHSVDGVSWTRQYAPIAQSCRRVTSGNGNYVAVSNLGAIIYADRELQWKTVQLPRTTGLFHSIAFGNGSFVAVGSPNLLFSSANGIDWTQADLGARGALTSAAFGNGTWLAVGSSSNSFVSVDAKNWQRVGTNPAYFEALTFGSGKFVAVVPAGGGIFTSTDGLLWQAQQSGTTKPLLSIGVAGETFVVVGGGGLILTSLDAVTWTTQHSGTSFGLSDVAFGSGRFVAVGGVILASDPIDRVLKQPVLTLQYDLIRHVFTVGFDAPLKPGTRIQTSTDLRIWRDLIELNDPRGVSFQDANWASQSIQFYRTKSP